MVTAQGLQKSSLLIFAIIGTNVFEAGPRKLPSQPLSTPDMSSGFPWKAFLPLLSSDVNNQTESPDENKILVLFQFLLPFYILCHPRQKASTYTNLSLLLSTLLHPLAIIVEHCPDCCYFFVCRRHRSLTCNAAWSHSLSSIMPFPFFLSFLPSFLPSTS